MGGKFRKYTGLSTTAGVLYKLYDFIVNSGQTVMRLVNDTGSAVALWNGTAFVASWASSADSPSGAYMVVEPVTANGGVRWQAKFALATNTLNVTLSPTGTWTNAGAAFSATCQTSVTQWNDAAAPGAASEVYAGCNTEAYGSSQTYTYLWFNLKDSSDATPLQFVYVGGYEPFNPATDLKPACLLARIPLIDNGATLTIGRGGSDANNLCRGTIEYAQTSAWTAAGYSRVGLVDATNIAPGATTLIRTIGGEYIGLLAYLIAGAAGNWLGHFNEHLQVIDASKNDYDTNTGLTKLVLGHLLLDYNEAL